MLKNEQVSTQNINGSERKAYSKPEITVRRFLFKNDIADTSYWETTSGDNEVTTSSGWFDMQ